MQLSNEKQVSVRVLNLADDKVTVNCNDVALCAAFRGQAVVIEPNCLTLFTNYDYKVSVKTRKEQQVKPSLDNINLLWLLVMFGKANFAIDDVDVVVDSYSPEKTVEIHIPNDVQVIQNDYA